MNIEIKIPALGEGIESGDVLEVFVQEGETIQKDQGLIELETDKAPVTVPSSAAGKVTKIHVKTGDTVTIGQVIASLEGTEAAAPTSKKTQNESKSSPTPSAPAKTSATAPETPAKPAPVEKVVSERAAKPAARVEEPVPAAAKVGAEVADTTSSLAQVPAGPAMRRFAREVGVDLRTVQPTGNHGRVTRDDILAEVRRGGSRPAAASSGVDQETDGSRDTYGSVRIEKMSKIRATIAQKMHESWTTVPRVTNFDDADVTELEQIRQSNKREYEARGIKLTSMPFLIKAVAMALRNHPIVNASIEVDSNQIIYKDYINIGVAIDTERGLVVPNLRHADKLAVPDIAKALGQMAENVRQGQFSVDDLRGGTFTISNLGAIGGSYSTPIINVPETAILLAGRARKMPVVRDDQVVIRLMMPLSISYDHRLIDGAAAARFLNDVIAYLESPHRLFLAL
ncbi:MAG TPA: dihydrolipoamide acetyltransferase family protein [Pirellulaceae bacterium]|nr:dihydrolipoamide acetyltransferase family protein [Pirellulaceae bacterium]